MNQIEFDIEQHVLSQTKKLSDGTVDKIFIRHLRSDNCMFSYDCRLCGVANLVGEKSLQMHINGKNHQQRSMSSYIADATQFRAQLVSPVDKTANNQSESIPLGYENDLTFECHLDKTLANIDKPLIGLEYVAELHDMNAKEPLYVCTLCDKRCDPRNIIYQVTSHRHRMKYLDFHFPSLMTILNQNHRFNTDMTYREEVLTHIAKLLEQKFERQKLFVCESRDYERRKIQITEEIMNGKHFNESDFPDCEKILLKKFQLSVLDSVSSESDNDKHDNYVKESKNKQDRVTRFADRKGEQPAARRSYSQTLFTHTIFPSTSRDTAARKILTPHELTENYIRDKYRVYFQSTVNDLQKQLKEHQKNPEKHPKYGEEWKNFWSFRYKELISQGKDANGHDYVPEWIEFWIKRLHELYDTEIEVKRREMRKRYLINNEEARKIEDKILSNTLKLEQRSQSLERSLQSPIEISDDSSDEDYNRYRSFRSHTHEKSPEYENEDINLVSVCRVLSVLEDELGMLAQRIIDLLSHSIAMEKSLPNSSDYLLFDSDNMILMETAKEKLKGGLAAGLIQSHRIAPVKRAITYIAKLIYEVSSKNSKQTLIQKSKVNHKETEKDVAKMEIARVVSQALAAQGKTDVSTEELEELIESFLGENSITVEKKEEKMEVTEEPKAVVSSKKEESTNDVEKLTDDDLIILLRNFSELTSYEQNHLITYLSKIEKTELSRAEKLRKYLDMGDMVIDEDEMDIEMAETTTISDDDYEDDQLIKSINKNVFSPSITNDLMSSTPQENIYTSAISSYVYQQPAYSFNELKMQQDCYNRQMNVMMMHNPSIKTFEEGNMMACSSSNNKNIREDTTHGQTKK